MRSILISGPASLAVILSIALAGCSKHDSGDVGQDLKNAGHDVSHEAGKIAHDPALKSVGATLKAAGHDVATEVKKAGAQAKSAAQGVAGSAKKAGHDVTSETHNERHAKRDES